MRKSTCSAATLALLLCCWVQAEEQRPPPPQPGEFPADVTVLVDAQGKVARVSPDAALPEVVRTLLATRIASWEFEVPRFHGQPVEANTRLHLRLQPATTTNGGYAIRIISGNVMPVVPGVYPQLRFRGRPPEGPHTLVYIVSIDTNGRVAGTERVMPKKLTRTTDQLDEMTRAEMRQLPAFQRTADGQPIACRAPFAMTYIFGGEPPPPLETPSDIGAIGKALPDLCPIPQLLTPIAGTAL